MRVTISGPPGTGKTTVGRLLSERLGMEYLSSGSVFRDMARELGLGLAEFGRLAEQDPRYDRMIDQSMVERARGSERLVLEGRLAAHNLAGQGIPALKVFLEADPEIRARRLMEREGGDLARTMEEMLEREECERARYLQWYGIDLKDRRVYDLVVDTSSRTPSQVVDLIIERLEG